MFANFIVNESGAVTVDWVVLTAGLAGLGLAVVGLFANSVEEPASAVNSLLQEEVVSSSLAFND